jgi:hypothetical protein
VTTAFVPLLPSFVTSRNSSALQENNVDALQNAGMEMTGFQSIKNAFREWRKLMSEIEHPSTGVWSEHGLSPRHIKALRWTITPLVAMFLAAIATGVGLRNISERLTGLYGVSALLSIAEVQPSSVWASVHIPKTNSVQGAAEQSFAVVSSVHGFETARKEAMRQSE